MLGREEFERVVGEAVAVAAIVVLVDETDHQAKHITAVREYWAGAAAYGVDFVELTYHAGQRALRPLLHLLPAEVDIDAMIALALQASR